jgi:lipopolysaccharide biosynthesis glycosyltransferase
MMSNHGKLARASTIEFEVYKHVLLCFDFRLLDPAKVLLVGLRETLSGPLFVYCIVDSDVMRVAEELISFARNIDITLSCNLTSNFLGSKRTKARAEISYEKYFFERVIPKDIHRLLYLDIDVVPLKKLDYLFELDFVEPFAAVALDDLRSRKFERWESVANAGVILFNVDVWRKMELAKKCSDFMLNFQGDEALYDELVINHAYYKNWKHLDSKYNTAYSKTIFMVSPISRSKLRIVHFMGPRKPWRRIIFSPFSLMFIQRYRKRLKTVNVLLKIDERA